MILVRKLLKFKERQDVSGSSDDRVCEIACAEMDQNLIICVYQPPSSNLTSFLEIMEDVLRKATSYKKSVVVCGNFNIDILSQSVEIDKLHFI